jgi:hypothetical protein
MASLANPQTIIGMAAVTLALMGLGKAFQWLGEGIGAAAPGIKAFFDGIGGVIEKVGTAISKVIETITTSIIRLQDIDPLKLMATAVGVTALGAAIALFGAGAGAGGVMSAIGSFFDEDPVEKFNRFATIDSAKLLQVASAITALGSAFKLFTSSVSSIGDTSGITSTIDKVMELHDAMSESPIEEAVNSVASGIGSIFDAATSWVSSIMPDLESVGSTSTAAGGGATATKEATLTEVSGLLKELIAKVDQPVQIKIGGRVVDEMEKQTSLRKTYNTKMDSGYGTFG